MTKHQLKVETQGTDLILTREFDAPKEKVFEAYTDCKHLRNWWGPREWPVSDCTIDFRAGGRWHYCMKGPDGTEAWGLATFSEIKESDLIVYQDHFSDKEGNISSSMPSAHIRNEFTEEDGLTTVRSTARYASEDDLNKVKEMGMIAGIEETLDRLEEYLSK
ncbi:SRPBCC domain-containing protein [Terrimonas sp. NA20]|uniref:SRPBCC domain-containing protein n=1 Tax=Terrimonas ginsenosidimutans TaxID=2908004 RepID=A0ABS9KUC7_9BACT|nr:SRPBCC domain-containing protein [Terrimonas ginsenosidimutans]MCG2615942.1 SRPBCC domain-containing protein [Terrimonas ginsenosidimutans]